jgi:cob(I)alamin adenosyltransferase
LDGWRIRGWADNLPNQKHNADGAVDFNETFMQRAACFTASESRLSLTLTMSSNIYTRTGDDGATGLADGSRTGKGALRIEVIGLLDELNALLGLMATYPDTEPEHRLVRGLQNSLFELGSELARPGSARITAGAVALLEQEIDRIDAELPALRNFILPGGSRAGALCHLARTVCRRAERGLFRLAGEEEVNSSSLRYLNRLSDLLFVLARWLVRQGGGEEIVWKSS